MTIAPDKVVQLACYVLSILSALISCFVVYFTVFVVKGKSFIATQVIRLHIFIVIELLTIFGVSISYSGGEGGALDNKPLCYLTAYLYYSSAIGNLFNSLLLSIYAHILFFYDKQLPQFLESKYLSTPLILTFVLPILPMFTDSYSKGANSVLNLCLLQQSGTTGKDFLSIAWAWIILYGFVVLAIIFSSYSFSAVLKNILGKRLDWHFASQYMKHYGCYPFITLLLWIPRLLNRLFAEEDKPHDLEAVNLIIICASSLLYGVMYCLGYKEFLKYENWYSQQKALSGQDESPFGSSNLFENSKYLTEADDFAPYAPSFDYNPSKFKSIDAISRSQSVEIGQRDTRNPGILRSSEVSS